MKYLDTECIVGGDKGAVLFPIGLMCILLGGELLTWNMMAVSIAYYAKKVSFTQLMINWLLIAFFNLLGVLFIANFLAILSV